MAALSAADSSAGWNPVLLTRRAYASGLVTRGFMYWRTVEWAWGCQGGCRQGRRQEDLRGGGHLAPSAGFASGLCRRAGDGEAERALTRKLRLAIGEDLKGVSWCHDRALSRPQFILGAPSF